MFKLPPLLMLLTLGLVACGSSGPAGDDAAQIAFFQAQPEFGAAPPPGSETVTPAQFMAAVQAGAKVVTSQSLAAEQAAQQQQDAQDDADARTYIAAHPDFAALLDPPTADALNADGDHRTEVPTAGSPRTVTLLGNRFGRTVLANHARTFPGQANQSRLYGLLYADLQTALRELNIGIGQFGLPAPDEVRNDSAERLLALNRRAGEVANEFRTSLYNVALLLDPANLEVGAGDQLDRTQTGSCRGPAAGGLYQNFDWPLKTLTTSVKDQGQRGTCWAFATVAALEAEIARRDHKKLNLSEQDYAGHRFLDWAPRAFGEGGDPLGIGQKASAANYTFAYEANWQYNKSLRRTEQKISQTYARSCDNYRDTTFKYGACSDSTDQGNRFSVTFKGKTYILRNLPDTGAGSGYQLPAPTDFWNQDDRDTSMVILLLRSVIGRPTLVTVDARYMKATTNAAPSMSNMSPDADGFVRGQTMRVRPDGKADWELDHVMTVTGFVSSRNLRQKLPNAPVADDYGYFVVKNSWGDCWGDQGYVYLPWTWIKTFTGQAITGMLPQ